DARIINSNALFQRERGGEEKVTVRVKGGGCGCHRRRRGGWTCVGRRRFFDGMTV
ncbi:hypothetical protein A2U01_0056055, partial [Trifolium medium]|nr:hypothetical protein [Trifolium medium]